MKTVTKYKDEVLDVKTCEDWQLIVAVGHWAHSMPELTKKASDALHRLVWSYSDGYGERGYIPCQGYDWSGIRDSSPEAKKEMAMAIRVYLTNLAMYHVVVREKLI